MYLQVISSRPDLYCDLPQTYVVEPIALLARLRRQAGIELSAHDIKVNERLQTTAANVWAMGDCAGSPLLLLKTSSRAKD